MMNNKNIMSKKTLIAFIAKEKQKLISENEKLLVKGKIKEYQDNSNILKGLSIVSFLLLVFFISPKPIPEKIGGAVGYVEMLGKLGCGVLIVGCTKFILYVVGVLVVVPVIGVTPTIGVILIFGVVDVFIIGNVLLKLSNLGVCFGIVLVSDIGLVLISVLTKLTE